MMQKEELVITALQQRIGEITSHFELQIAILRAEITQLVNNKNDKEKAIEDYADSLNQLSN